VAEAKPEMLQQPPADPPVIQPNGPVVMDLNQKARELQDQIDRAIDRIRYTADYADDYYPSSYYYSGYYPSVYYYPYPVYVRHHHHFRSHPGTSFSGSYHSGNFSGRISTGNYVHTGANYIGAPAGGGMRH
jgi:hypothetical protein